jgi:hypothetical protein
MRSALWRVCVDLFVHEDNGALVVAAHEALQRQLHPEDGQPRRPGDDGADQGRHMVGHRWVMPFKHEEI